MSLNRIARSTAAVTGLGLAALIGLPATVSAQPASGTVSQCADGLVVVHTDGQSIWADSGDAKYQLVEIDGTASGHYLDKKTGQLVPFSFDFSKTWTSGNKPVIETCVAHHDQTNPTTGEDEHIDITAQLRQVQ